MGKIIGIDLGTTNCCVAVVDALAPKVLPNREGSRTTPSIVAFADDDDRLVGQIAKRQAVTNPQNTVFAVKRLIGRKYEAPEVQRAREVLPFALTKAENGDVRVLIRGREYSPQEISAFILTELKNFAQESLGEDVEEAIVTVPAYFDDSQRQATKDAGKIAGLEVRRIINEPTAAALAYGFDRDQESNRTIAIYDLGGGTFDISILEMSKGIFEVRGTSGDSFLGGEDFDQCIMDWLIAEFRTETDIDLRTDRMALQRLKEAGERAKCELSTAEEAAINLPFISADESGPRHLSRSLTRSHFEDLVRELVDRTEGPCLEAMEAAEVDPDDIDEILLVGGQTRSPIVIKSVEKMFGKSANREINPDEVVSMGAAIQAGILRGEIKDVVLLDVTPLSLGIETHGGLFTTLIARNSTIPTKNTQIFTTVIDNQDKVEIHCMQGEREIAAENRSLGRFELVGIPPAPRGVPQVEVTFAIDSNGIVNVSARDLATNQQHGMEVNASSGLTNEEIDRLVKDAQEFAQEDAKRRELRRFKNRLEGLIYSNERVFEQFQHAVNENEKKRIHQSFLRARMALNEDERSDLEAAIFDLNTISQKLSQIMLEKTDQAES
ncbi:MAG: molecular chaperone DnaK [bacterium]|nr:molecular chaperone DnaK [bacterium]